MTRQYRKWHADLPNQPDIEKILILKWSAMGDIVIATAAMSDISRAFPNASIHLNTTSPWHRLFEHDDRYDRVDLMDLDGKDKGVRGLLRFAKMVKREAYDVVFDFQSNDHSRLALGLSAILHAKPRYRAGCHRLRPYNIAGPSMPHPAHAGGVARSMLEAAGVPVAASRPQLAVPEVVRTGVTVRLRQLGLDQLSYAVFLPGCQAAGYLKRWGALRYAELAKRLLLEGKIERIVILGGADETEECEAIAAQHPDRIVNLCGKTELLELLPICEHANFIVANDTGTAHLASATGRPMCVICGPTDPRRVKPLGVNVTTCQADLACINCYRKDCSHHSCMAMVSPAEVARKLLGPGC